MAILRHPLALKKILANLPWLDDEAVDRLMLPLGISNPLKVSVVQKDLAAVGVHTTPHVSPKGHIVLHVDNADVKTELRKWIANYKGNPEDTYRVKNTLPPLNLQEKSTLLQTAPTPENSRFIVSCGEWEPVFGTPQEKTPTAYRLNTFGMPEEQRQTLIKTLRKEGLDVNTIYVPITSKQRGLLYMRDMLHIAGKDSIGKLRTIHESVVANAEWEKAQKHGEPNTLRALVGDEQGVTTLQRALHFVSIYLPREKSVVKTSQGLYVEAISTEHIQSIGRVCTRARDGATQIHNVRLDLMTGKLSTEKKPPAPTTPTPPTAKGPGETAALPPPSVSGTNAQFNL